MKGCLYDYTFTLPNKDIIQHKKLNMKDLCTKIQDDLIEHYYLDDFIINNQIIYNLQKRPQFCNKILKNRCSVSKHVFTEDSLALE